MFTQFLDSVIKKVIEATSARGTLLVVGVVEVSMRRNSDYATLSNKAPKQLSPSPEIAGWLSVSL
jgi:hypothetical protein